MCRKRSSTNLRLHISVERAGKSWREKLSWPCMWYHILVSLWAGHACYITYWWVCELAVHVSHTGESASWPCMLYHTLVSLWAGGACNITYWWVCELVVHVVSHTGESVSWPCMLYHILVSLWAGHACYITYWWVCELAMHVISHTGESVCWPCMLYHILVSLSWPCMLYLSWGFHRLSNTQIGHFAPLFCPCNGFDQDMNWLQWAKGVIMTLVISCYQTSKRNACVFDKIWTIFQMTDHGFVINVQPSSNTNQVWRRTPTLTWRKPCINVIGRTQCVTMRRTICGDTKLISRLINKGSCWMLIPAYYIAYDIWHTGNEYYM